ncbi:MAG: phosphate acyltransferase PlsX, partial [Eudoraea sp.]|nr:phosphate acyltransferase PlsX [Eudoraea sp.]
KDEVTSCLNKHDASYLPITVKHASEIVKMDDNPLDVFRKKKNSSIRIGMQLLADKEGDAFVSAGNSGAVVSTSLFVLKRIKGIDRPAIATIMPTLSGRVIVADAGANNTCKPFHLAQFAIMCSVYSRYFLKCRNPRIGILSNGEEENKGTEVIRSAHALLSGSSLNFKGFVEGGDVFNGSLDVAVCDGFAGNILLKTAEGVAESLGSALKEELSRTILSKIGYLFSRYSFMRLKKRFDYSEYGGAPLLGVNGPVIISHGRSNANAIMNAARAARDLARSNVTYHLQNDMDVNKDLQTIARKPSLIDRVLRPINTK